MAIFTALAAAATWLFSGTLIANLALGALSFGLQLGLSYLQRPKKRAYSAVQGQREYGARVPAWTFFGTGKGQGHHIFYAKWGAGNKFNADVFVLANGWCDGLEPEIYFYGEKHALVEDDVIDNEVKHYRVDGFGNLISIRFYDGRPGQGVDTKLVSDTASLGQNWKSTSVCAGMAYVVVERQYSESAFDKGEPQFEFVLRGLRLYDPRKDDTVAGGEGDHRLANPSTWEFSKNPALQRLNYQLGLRGLISNRTIIGEGKSLGQLDLGSYVAAMNACDAIREGKPTYEASLLVTSDDDHTEILKEFDDAMAGYGMNRRGLSGVIPGAPQVPVLDIGPDDLDMERPKSIRHRKSAFDLYNHMSGQFTSPEANWNAESLDPVYSNTDASADGRVRQTANDFLQVADPDIAQYLLQIRYRQNRKGGAVTLPVSRRAGFQVQEGEWVTYAGKTWLITGWACDEALRVTLTLAETGADVYSSDGIEPGPIVVPPTPPTNPSLLSTVQGFDIEVGMIEGEAGYEQPVLRFTWDPPDDPTITTIRFQYYIDGETTVFEGTTGDVEAGEYITTLNVVSGKVYHARATIITVPDRFKQWTGWETTETATGRISVKTFLASVGDDVRGLLERTRAELDAMRAQMRSLAMGGGEVAAKVATETLKSVEFRGATARVFEGYDAFVEETDGTLEAFAGRIEGAESSIEGLETDKLDASVITDYYTKTETDGVASSAASSATASLKSTLETSGGSIYEAQQDASTALGALGSYTGSNAVATAFSNTYTKTETDGVAASAASSAVSGVQAEVDQISGDGLWKMEVVAGSGDVTARGVIMMRATISDDFVEVGTVWEAGFVGGNPAAPFSRQVNLASQHIWQDPDGEFPLFVLDGDTAWLNNARIRNLDADNIDVNALTATSGFFDNVRITDSLQLDDNVVIEGAIANGAIHDSDIDDFTGTTPNLGSGSFSPPQWQTIASATVKSPSNHPILMFYTVLAAKTASNSPGSIAAVDARIIHNGNLISGLEWGASVGAGLTAGAGGNGVRMIPALTTGDNTIEIQVAGYARTGGIGNPIWGTVLCTNNQIVVECAKK